MLIHPELADFLNYWLSFLSLVGLAIVILWALALFTPKTTNPLLRRAMRNIAQYAPVIGFFVALVGTFFSLFYSEYIGYLPCALCWFQRILLYPQVILFGIAWWKKDEGVYQYTGALSFLGLVVSAYHYYIQLGYNEIIPCAANAIFVDCAKPSFVEFGFVTFPFMSIVFFSVTLLLSITMHRAKKGKWSI